MYHIHDSIVAKKIEWCILCLKPMNLQILHTHSSFNSPPLYADESLSWLNGLKRIFAQQELFHSALYPVLYNYICEPIVTTQNLSGELMKVVKKGVIHLVSHLWFLGEHSTLDYYYIYFWPLHNEVKSALSIK